MSWLQKIYWNHFGKPVTDRALFSALLSRTYDSVLEVGVGSGARTRRIAKLIQSHGEIRYIGTDPFESASEPQLHMTLKAAHQFTGQLGWRASLLPGEPAGALPRVAHKFGPSQLVIIDGGVDPANPLSGQVGSWLDRVADPDSTILVCEQAGQTLQLVDAALISQRLSAAA